MSEDGEHPRRRRRRRATAEAGPPGAAAPAAAAPAAAAPAAAAPPPAPVEKPRPPRQRRPSGEGTGERGLRDLVGSGRSQLGLGRALRGRDVNRPTEDDLAEAEREIDIVRRGWRADPGR